MEFETIVYDKKDGVGWIILNRPEVLNAQNEKLTSELQQILEDVIADDAVFCIVITGAGEKAFSAGADIGDFLKWTMLDVVKMFRGAKRCTDLIRQMPKPAIAMVKGFCLGGGCELAMACDIIVAADNARFGQPEVSVGVIPGAGGTQVLPRLVGDKKARELVFTGEIIDAEEALRVGLVNKVVPVDKLDHSVNEVVNKLKAKSPAILKIAKMALNKALETTLSVGLECETDFFAMCFGTEDQKEGTRAFLEKRNAKYSGR